MCRRRNQTYIATSVAPHYQYQAHCRGRRRRRHQHHLVPVVALPPTTTLNNPLSAETQTYLRPAACKRECKGRSCRKHTPLLTAAATPTTYNSNLTTSTPSTAHRDISTTPEVHTQPQQTIILSTCPRRRRGPIASMASLLIVGLGIGAQKLSDKRKEKKAQKAALEMEAQAAEKEARRAEAQREGRSRRKSKDAAEERRSSVSEERDAPPSYDPAPSYEPPSYGAVVQDSAGSRA